jgi:hypothetical protein
MSTDFESAVSKIVSGTSEQKVAALDDYCDKFATMMSAAADAMVADESVRPFIAERVIRLARSTRRAFEPVFSTSVDEEVKFHGAVILCELGNKDAARWLLSTASAPGRYQYEAARQLAFLGVSEVGDVILCQLRAIVLTDVDVISGLLSAWKALGEPLPEDVRSKLLNESAPRGVKVALEFLKL